MLQLDLEAFRQAASWDRLPYSVAARNFHLTASDATFPGALLPAVRPNGDTYWYAVAATGAQWRQLQPLVLAYAGPTVSDFNGRSTVPDLTVPAERILHEAGVCAMARVVPGKDCLPLLTYALDRLRFALSSRPLDTRAVPETTGSILAQLDMSLAAGARFEASRLLGRLRGELRLDTLNLHFLEVRILAVFRAWREMVEAEWFADLCEVRKPAAIAASMLEALWHVYLAPIERDPARLAERYRTEVQRFARPMLAQAPEAANGILARLRALESPPEMPVPQAPAVLAQELLDQAAEAPSQERVAKAQAAIEALPEPQRERLLGSAAAQQALVELGSLDAPQPTDWASWLQALADPLFQNAVLVAREGADSWPAQLVTNEEQAATLAEKFLEVGLSGGDGQRRLTGSLPSLVRWVKKDPDYPRPELRPLYLALSDLFSLVERRDASTRDAAADLLEAMLSTGLTTPEYERVLKGITTLIDDGAGRSSVYWLLDVADILLQHPTPSSSARLTILNRVLSSMQALLAGLTPGQRAAYDRIATGASWPVLPAPLDESAADRFEGLRGKTVAIYTLTESAGRQAEATLRALVPGVHIELAHDHVASPRLTRLARDADLFVLTAASAKHAATDCILSGRGNRPLIHAAGRGFSSIVRAVEEYAQKNLSEQ